MSSEIGKLTALKVDRLKLRVGMHGDGAGLYLQVKNGGASWVLRFQINGKPRYMGLGPLTLFGLKDARTRALEAKKLKHDGTDPIAERRRKRAQQRLEAANSITFDEAAKQCIAKRKGGWRNEKHAAQWQTTLATYASPVLGSVPVKDIDTPLVMKVLDPIWSKIPETAKRVRQRMEVVLDWATAFGYRQGPNPARWRGNLKELLPPPGKVRAVKHHTALPYAVMPEFMVALADQAGTAALALEFTILTAARTGEVIGARWQEIDFAQKIWIVPAGRMKSGKEHRVPLSSRAIEILLSLKPDTPSPDAFVFQGGAKGKPMSNMAMTMVLRRMKREDLTVHGFRSSFRDWAAERTGYANEVAEMALAHAVGDRVEAAYRRGDMFEKRRRIMANWCEFCRTPNRANNGTVAVLHKSR